MGSFAHSPSPGPHGCTEAGGGGSQPLQATGGPDPSSGVPAPHHRYLPSDPGQPVTSLRGLTAPVSGRWGRPDDRLVFRRAGFWGKKSLPQDTGHQCPRVPCRLLLLSAMVLGSGPRPFPRVSQGAQGGPGLLLPRLGRPALPLQGLGPATPSSPSLRDSETPLCSPGLIHIPRLSPAAGCLLGVLGMCSLPEDTLGQSSAGLPGLSSSWGAVATPQTQSLQLLPSCDLQSRGKATPCVHLLQKAHPLPSRRSARAPRAPRSSFPRTRSHGQGVVAH